MLKSFELIVSFYMRRINSFYQSVCRTNRKADEEPTLMLNLVNYLFYPTECAEIDVVSVSTARSSRDLAIVQQSPAHQR